MFYKELNFQEESPSMEFYLLNNFLDQTPKIVDTIAVNFQEMSYEEVDNMKYKFSLSKIMNETFQLISRIKMDFKIEQVTNTKDVYSKLAENGLVGEFLIAKLSVLDWLWEKAESLFVTLRSGQNTNLFYQLINQLKSILSSLLNCLGFSADIFNEAIDLLMSFIEMSNQNYQA